MSPPNWRWATAKEITADNVSNNRLVVTPVEMFGLEVPFNRAELKKRFVELLRTYHSDLTHDIDVNLKSILDDRVYEITEANSVLKQHVASRSITKPADKRASKSGGGLHEPSGLTVDELTKKKRRRDKV